VASGAAPCTSTLAAKASCTIAVNFRPTMNGVINGAVTVKYNGSFSPLEVTLSGTGSTGSIAPLSFSPASLTFANISVGTTSVGQTVTVTNTSTSAVSISNIAASGNYSVANSGTAPCTGTLSSGARCTFTVSFSPTINGVIKGAVTVTDNSGVNPQVYNLSGTAVLPVRFSPANVSFASQAVGATSAPQTVILISGENAALTINGIVASGQFKAAPGGANPCGSTLAAFGQCTFTVTFTPEIASSISGVVTVNYGGSFSPVELQLTGVGH
jgi:Abnormal spindle-like microcephaly-assoc'd, ASPM-SPD-2-Hydin